MKSILLSIKPKYVADILNGRKTIEIRKTMPKCNLPIDVYIYCTKGKEKLVYIDYTPCGDKGYITTDLDCENEEINGRVVAKFTLNRIDRYHVLPSERLMPFNRNVEEKLNQLCLTKEEVMTYGNGEDYYACLWHISNLVIFDKPKELSDFIKWSWLYEDVNDIDIMRFLPTYSLTKAPQSYCYVEVSK